MAQGTWSPHRPAQPWIRFCLTAHFRQATTLLRRIRETEALWDQCAQVANHHGLPERTVGALCDAVRGWRLRRSLYVKITQESNGEPISENMATRDLTAMTRAGLLVSVGQKRGRHYEPSGQLRDLWLDIRADHIRTPIPDPYVDLLEPKLPGID
ncbi:MAG: hypothetical protein ACK5PP_05330 [Acidimicrobiales bacterium]